MLIKVLCEHVCGLPAALVTGIILPGCARSILLGNLFYARQAYTLTPFGTRPAFGFGTAPAFAGMYLLSAGILALLHVTGRSRDTTATSASDKADED